MSSETVVLRFSDNEEMTVNLEILNGFSEMARDMVEDVGTEQVIPFPNVSRPIFSKMFEFAEYHATHEQCAEWDNEFFSGLHQSELFEMICASNYLNAAVLLDASCAFLAGLMRNKTPDELRATFNIKNDFTPQEEEEIRRESEWAFS